MRIGINLLYLIPGQVGGTETYARELLAALSQQVSANDKLIIYCSRETSPTWQSSNNIKIVTLPFYSRNRIVRLLIEQTLLPLRCLTDRLDVIFSLGYSAPFLHSCPSLVTIHDLNWFYHQEDFSFFSRLIWQLVTTLSARSADHILTDSRASAKSIISIFKVPKTKVTAILHGVPSLLKTVKQKNQPYLLTVIAGYPHKNLKTLIQAFAQISPQFPNLLLKICGLGGKADSGNNKLINQLDLTNKVEILGYVSRQELANLYRNALIFVFPSAYEGFGYPVVEAMSYHVPVVSSNAYSLKEVVGEAGILVDPYNQQGFAKSVQKLIKSKSLRENLVNKGNQRVKALSWDKTAAQTLKVLRRLVK